MFCNKCGKTIEDGSRFCNHCGTPVEKIQPAPAYNPVPIPLNRGNREAWIIAIIIVSVLMIVTMLMSGASASIWDDDMTIKLKLPLDLIASGVSQFKKAALIAGEDTVVSMIGGMVFWLGTCRVLTAISTILLLISLFMVMKKKSLGIIAGLLASAVTVLFAIIAIITIFGAGSDLSMYIAMEEGTGSGLSLYPTLCVWLSLILGLGNGVLLLVKGKEIIS